MTMRQMSLDELADVAPFAIAGAKMMRGSGSVEPVILAGMKAQALLANRDNVVSLGKSRHASLVSPSSGPV
jgi:hypothetical protein